MLSIGDQIGEVGSLPNRVVRRPDSRHHQGDLAANATTRPLDKLAKRPALDLFIRLGELPAHGRLAIGSKRRCQGSQRFAEPVRRLEEHHRARLACQLPQPGIACTCAAGQESLEAEAVDRQPGQRQRRRDRRRARQARHRDPVGKRGHDQAISRVGDRRHACVCDEQHPASAQKLYHQLGRAGAFVGLEVRNDPGSKMDAEVSRQTSKPPSVFRGNDVSRLERRPQPRARVARVAKRNARNHEFAKRRQIRRLHGAIKPGRCSFVLVTATELRPLIAPTTSRDALRDRARKALAVIGPPFGALVAGWTLIASRAPKGWTSVFDPATFNHWDADQYLSIAEHGYRASAQCNVALTFPSCGNLTWFPGYPGVTRVLASTHIGYPAAALAVAWICWYLTLLMVWVLSAERAEKTTRGGTSRRIACLALAAVFPGQVYFAALFPVSLLTFTMLLCIWLATRSTLATRATLVRTGVAGVVAGLAYPLACAAAPALVVSAFVTRGRQARITMLTGAAAVVAGFALVLAYAQLRVGMWNAYFVTERHEYGVKAHNPLTLLDARYRQFLHPSSSWFRIVTQQGALATLLVVVAIAVTVPALARARRSADATDLALLGTACVAWLVPYVGAGGLSIYRSEACLIVLVPLLRRLPIWEIAALAGAAAAIAYDMAPLFFSNALI